jgi:hypothetical protein
MEVEKRTPGAGANLVDVFFPAGVKYDADRFPFKRERKFWKWAFQTINARK